MDESQKYLLNQIESCSNEEIVILLLNRAIKYSHDLSKSITNKEHEKRVESLTKISDIISFLVYNIKEDKLPSLCKIFKICMNKLVFIEQNKDLSQIEELIKVLKNIKESFYLRINKNNTKN